MDLDAIWQVGYCYTYGVERHIVLDGVPGPKAKNI